MTMKTDRLAIRVRWLALLLVPLGVALPSALVAKAHASRAPASATTPAARCGWVINPTPANWWLVDRDGEWVMGVQGGYQAPGLDEIPDLSTRQWVVTNGSSYGYGCACMTADVNRRQGRITRIRSLRQKPLALCRADRRLKRPD
jgi:hypothetical protein